jgi:PKD repeat protein
MNNKGLSKIIFGLGFLLVLGICFTACKEEEIPAPSLSIFVTVDGFTVNIAAESPEATAWQWNYGDGTVSDSAGSHLHTYITGGEFTIECTVTGEGGTTTKTKEVTIATIEDLLSGGAEATSGKTWVLSRTPGGNDGVGHIKVELVPNIFPAIADLLEYIGLPDEYDNEYTFHFDGSYEIDNINGDVMAPWVYCSFEVDPGDIVHTTSYGFFQITYANPESPTWTLHENAQLIVETVYDEDIDIGPKPGIPETITYENVDFITFDGDGFIGLQDYTTTAMIREIGPDRMVITVFYHEFMGDPGNDGDLYLRPSLALTLSYNAK